LLKFTFPDDRKLHLTQKMGAVRVLWVVLVGSGGCKVQFILGEL
jgi:hypothetical protein